MVDFLCSNFAEPKGRRVEAPSLKILLSLVCLVGPSTPNGKQGIFFMHHSFDISYAKQYGVDEAIMISNFQYWLKKNWSNDKHRYDGRTWTYNSVASYEKLFPYWTGKQIRRVIESLVDKGVLIRGEYNKNVYDRTSWYAFVDESTFLFENIDLPIWANQDAHLGKPIPNINTDSKPNKKTNTDRQDFGDWSEAMHAWINYRKSIKKPFKTERGITSALNDLKKVCKNDFNQAMLVVEYCMNKEWQGIYAPKEPLTGPTNTGLHVDNEDFKLGKYRYRRQHEFASYDSYVKNCQQYGHTIKPEGYDYDNSL